MFVDMPPGTGDVPLTVFQSLPVDGIIVVTSPQQLVSLIVEKAVNMAAMMNVPVLGVVENMAWAQCPHCGEKAVCVWRKPCGRSGGGPRPACAGPLPAGPAACKAGRFGCD